MYPQVSKTPSTISLHLFLSWILIVTCICLGYRIVYYMKYSLIEHVKRGFWGVWDYIY